MSQDAEFFVVYDCDECNVCSNLRKERCNHKRIFEFYPDLNDVRETNRNSVFIEIWD